MDPLSLAVGFAAAFVLLRLLTRLLRKQIRAAILRKILVRAVWYQETGVIKDDFAAFERAAHDWIEGLPR